MTLPKKLTADPACAQRIVILKRKSRENKRLYDSRELVNIRAKLM